MTVFNWGYIRGQNQKSIKLLLQLSIRRNVHWGKIVAARGCTSPHPVSRKCLAMCCKGIREFVAIRKVYLGTELSKIGTRYCMGSKLKVFHNFYCKISQNQQWAKERRQLPTPMWCGLHIRGMGQQVTKHLYSLMITHAPSLCKCQPRPFNNLCHQQMYFL